MHISTLRHCAAPLTGAALVAGMLLIGGGQAAAQTTTTSFKSTCRASATINVDKTKDDSVIVNAPTTVVSGETFTFTIQPGPASYPDSDSGATTSNLSRLKFDFEIPNNTTFVQAAVLPNTGKNLDGVPAGVLRINTSGSADSAGPLLRLSGNNEVIANGTSNSTNSEGGIRAPKLKKNLDGSSNSNGDSWFQMPAVEVTVVAGTAGTAITPKVRTSGSAGSYNASENFSTQLAKATFLGGTQWAPTKCSPRDGTGSGLNRGAGALATIAVSSADAPSTTQLNLPASTYVGTEITLTAGVSGGTSGGTVQFKDGDNLIGGPVAVVNGTAALPHTFTTAGDHSVTAEYSGVSGVSGSTSAPKVIKVQSARTATSVAVTAPENSAINVPVDLSATISPTPTGGTVQFKDGSNNLGAPQQVTSAQVKLTTSFTTPGQHSITAIYSGTTEFAGSTSTPQIVGVAAADSVTTTFVNLSGSAATGDQVALSASVFPTPTGGTIQFKDGGVDIGAPVELVGGTANLTHSFDSAGSHSVTAIYSGAAGFTASTSLPKTITIDDGISGTTTVVTVPESASTRNPVELRATINPAPAGGTVQFADAGVPLGDPVAVDNGVAVVTHSFTTAGTHAITALYSGDPTSAGSVSTAQSIEVTSSDVATSTTVTVPATARTGGAVDLKASVEPKPSGGTVQFTNAGSPIGYPVNVVDGVATLSHVFTNSGSHDIAAAFSGAVGFDGSTSALGTVEVSLADLGTATLLSVPGEAKTGAAYDLWASVFELPSGQPVSTGGTVQFSDGGVSLGAPVFVFDGVAKLTHTFSTTGAHEIVATYSGSEGRNGSAAQARSINVSQATASDISTATVISVPGTVTVGSQISLSANVIASETAGGTVQFMDGDTPIGQAVVLVNGVATMGHTFDKVGAHPITAVYSGAAGFSGSTSAATSVLVEKASTGNGGGGSSDFLPFGS